MGINEAQEISSRIEGKSIRESLMEISKMYPGRVIFTTSFGIEDQVITDIILKNDIPVRIVTLDTGRLFEETYKVFSNTLKKYNKKIETFFPDREDVENLLTEKGPYSFYRSVEERKECCFIRKVKPLGRALKGMNVWITGIRADQSSERTVLTNVEYESDKDIVKYHPVIDWTLKEIEDYLAENHVPYNELHEKGSVSIGCAPCTRAVKKGEDFRSGRWWWEDQSGKECGLHEKR